MHSPEPIHITISEKESSNLQWPLLLGVVVTLLLLVFQSMMTAIGLGWSLFLFLLFLRRLGRSFPVLELMLLMAALQWIVGAKISYASEFSHFRYHMYVEEDVYMGIVVPGVIAFSLGILFFQPKYSFQQMNDRLQKLMLEHKKIAYYLIVIGLASTYISPYTPVAVRFILYLTASFQYVGLALLLFQPNSNAKWRWFVIIIGGLTISSISQGMFHDLLLWSALLFSFVVIQLKIQLFGKMALILAGILFASSLQAIKSEFRSQLGGKTTEEKVILFADLIQGQLTGAEEREQEEDDITDMASTRLNQGWIISAIIFNVPAYEPFAKGETITEALVSSFVPRFLDPDKKEAGGRENFRRFTGLGIREGTSMGTSVMGEAYGNYGTEGAWLFMFCWGALLAFGFGRLMKYGRKHAIIIVFIPLIFLQVIKAETELIVVLNHFVKSLILVFGFLWFARRYLRWQV